MGGIQLKYVYRVIAISMIILLLSTGCHMNEDTGKGIRVIESGLSVSNEGILYSCLQLNNALCFYDFESMQSVYLCAEPNCNHTDHERCKAFRSSHMPFLYNEKLYYFTGESYYERDGSIKHTTKLIESDFSGSVEKTITEFEADNITSYICYLVGDTLYYIGAKIRYTDLGSSNYSSHSLFSINLSDGRVNTIGKILDGYNVNIMPHGIIDNKLFLTIHYTEDDINFADYNMEDWSSIPLRYNCHMDLESGIIEKIDLPVPTKIVDNYYYYNKRYDNGAYKFVARDWRKGTERVIYDGPVGNNVDLIDGKMFFSPVEGIDKNGDPIRKLDDNGVIFFSDIEYSYDLKKGKLTTIQKKISNRENLDIVASSEDKYIVFYKDIDNNIHNRLAYISKVDYLNGMDDFVLIDLPS